MRVTLPTKVFSIIIIALGLVVGCATQPKPTPEPEEQETGPSAAATQALNAARAAIEDAKALDWVWRDTGKIYEEAQKAAAEGDDARAIKLANKAREQAEDAQNQYYLEHAKPMLEELQRYNLDGAQERRLQDAAQAIKQAQGKKAYNMLKALKSEVSAANIQYTVTRGDSLWAISGKPSIYNNPYQWPLIYKANSDKIEDADLIYPGQVFNIDQNPAAAEVEAAVEHAKTRGAWSLGEVEESDREYLGGLRIR